MKESVTIVVSCYSHQRFFRRTLESAIAQADDAKVVLFDNGSEASYQREIENAALEFKLKLIRAPINTYGLSFRMLVLDSIDTEFIAFLHDDDIYSPGMISTSLEMVRANDLDFVVSNVRYIDSRGQPWIGYSDTVNQVDYNGSETVGLLLADLFKTPGRGFHFCTALMRTDLAFRTNTGDPFFPRIADVMYWADLLLDSSVRYAIIREPLTFVRIHDSNDRSYDRFTKLSLAKAHLKLHLSEVELYRRIFFKSNDEVFGDFLSHLVVSEFEARKGDPIYNWVNGAVLLSAQFNSPASRLSFVLLMLHSAYSRDPRRTASLVEELTGQDLNTFMSRNYDALAHTLINFGKEALSDDEQPIESKWHSTKRIARRAWRHPTKIPKFLLDHWRVRSRRLRGDAG